MDAASMAPKYDAFISYSHAADGALAPALQAALQSLARPLFRLHALRIFRDATSLSASPELWPAIETALREARHFLLLASPAGAQSKWVQREVAWWLAHRSAATMFVLVTEGELDWDETGNDFHWARTNCLPREPLAGRFKSEPLWVDLRWARQGETLTLRHTRFRQAVLDIAAPLHGVDKDQLDSDDVRRLARVRRLSAGVMVGLAILAGVAFSFFIQARQQRAEAERRGVISEARRLAAEADLARVQGQDADLPLLLAAEGIRLLGDIGVFDMAVDLSLRRALAAAPRELLVAPEFPLLRLLEDGSWDTAALMTYWTKAQTEQPDVLAGGDCRRQLGIPVIAAASRGQWCVTYFEDQVDIYRGTPGQPPHKSGSLHIGDVHPSAGKFISEDGRWLAVDEVPKFDASPANPQHRIRVWDVGTGRLVHSEFAMRFFGFAPSSHHFATASGWWRVPFTTDGSAERLWEWVNTPKSVAVSRNGQYIAARGGSDDDIELWSLDLRNCYKFVEADPGSVLAIDDAGTSLMLGSSKQLQLLLGSSATRRFALDVRSAVFLPEGPRVLTSSGEVQRVLDLPPEAAETELRGKIDMVDQLVGTADSVFLFTHEELETEPTPGLIQKSELLRLKRWDLGSSELRTVFALAGAHELVLSADGRLWAVASQGGHVLHIGHTDMSSPPLQVASQNKITDLWVAPTGDVAAVIEGGRVAVRDSGGVQRWLSPPLGQYVKAAMLSADRTRVLALVHDGETQGIGLDSQARWALQTWNVASTDSRPQQSFDLGFHDRAPDSLCFVSRDGHSVRKQGKWQALTAGGPLASSDLQDSTGCQPDVAHRLQMAWVESTSSVDILRQGQLRHRLESATHASLITASAGGEVAVVLDGLGRLRAYPLSHARLVAQACRRKPRLLAADEALRLFGPAVHQDACGRRWAPPAANTP